MLTGRVLLQDRQFGKARMICAMFEYGWTYPEICQATGMGAVGINTLLKAQKLKPSQKVRAYTRSQEKLERMKAILMLHESGWKQREIAEVHGITQQRVQRILSDARKRRIRSIARETELSRGNPIDWGATATYQK